MSESELADRGDRQARIRDLMRELTLPTPARPTIEALVVGLDFDELRQELARQRLLGLLGMRLLAFETSVPQSFKSAVLGVVEVQRAQACVDAVLAWSILSEFEASGVRAMPLKGPLLAERMHGDLALRSSNDIDLLVSAEQMPEAVATLERIGGVRPRKGEALPELHHHFSLGDGKPIELHWRIYWFDRNYTPGLLARAIRRDGLWIPSPADELISLLLFHARDGLIGLRMPADIAACWHRHDDVQTIAQVRAVVLELPHLRQPVAAAALSVERVLGIDIASRLELPMTKRSRVAVELTDWAVRRDARDLDLTVKLVDGLTAPADGLVNYLRRTFIPRLEGSRKTRLRLGVLHAGAFLARIALAMARIRRETDRRGRSDLSADRVRNGNAFPLH